MKSKLDPTSMNTVYNKRSSKGTNRGSEIEDNERFLKWLTQVQSSIMDNHLHTIIIAVWFCNICLFWSFSVYKERVPRGIAERRAYQKLKTIDGRLISMLETWQRVYSTIINETAVKKQIIHTFYEISPLNQAYSVSGIMREEVVQHDRY